MRGGTGRGRAPGYINYFFKLWTYAATLSRSAPVTPATGFILPCPSVTTFLISAVLSPRGFISTFIIFAMDGLPCPSAPWQLLHLASKIVLPAAASAAQALVEQSARIVHMMVSPIAVLNCYSP